jgi:hypothetical protein
MKCDKCGYSDNGSGDWAHACGPVAIQRQPVANERIRELINEATSFKEGDTEGKYDIEVFDKEKFAVLIVQECANMAESFHHHQYDFTGNLELHEFIKEHFGVEE